MSRGIVHRDVAARNVLIHLAPTGGRYVCKISDLGLARLMKSMYSLTDQQIPMPTRVWLAGKMKRIGV